MTVKPKPKYRAVAVALFGATVLLLFLWVRKQREPHYEEKPLLVRPTHAAHAPSRLKPGNPHSKVNVALWRLVLIRLPRLPSAR